MMLYSIVPFFLMTIFNVLLVKKTRFKQRKSGQESANGTKNASRINKFDEKKRRATISQLVLTILFLVMTLPTSVAYGALFKYKDQNEFAFSVMDNILFVHNAAQFVKCFISYRRFRKIATTFVCKWIRPVRSVFNGKRK